MAASAALLAAQAASATLPRFPEAYAGRIVFVANGNLWSVPRAGGAAQQLTNGPGQDMVPHASPDGKWIAYTHTDKGGSDVWVIPATGGAARQLTFRPAVTPGTGGPAGPDNMVVTWTPDSTRIVYLTRRNQWNPWIRDMYSVPVKGGDTTAMPIDSAVGLASFAPDGRTIAYNRIFQNFRSWKRYNGGLAQQIFTYDLTTRRLEQITQWSGTNTSPMWYGRKVYYLSDQDQHRRANLWVYDLDSRQRRQITHFTDYDIDFPALGDDAITFQQGGKLRLLTLRDERLHEIAFTLPRDNPRTHVRSVPVKEAIRSRDPADQINFALAPAGDRGLFAARGDIFSVPGDSAASRNVTSTAGVDEDHPAWSPDGQWIAYTTDIGGGQQLALRPALGGRERVLTHFKTGYFYKPVFSPDARQLSFSDGEHRLWLVGANGAGLRQVAQDKYEEIHDQAFSPDGRWLAFSMTANGHRRDIYLFELATGRLTRMGPGGSSDANPAWSADGKYLFFTSSRHENLASSDQEFDFALLKSTGLYAVPLTKETPSPVAPRPAGEAGAQSLPPGNAEAPIRIDFDGLMDRAVVLPVEPGNIAQLDARAGRLFYLTQPIALMDGTLPGESSALRVYALASGQDRVIARDVDGYSLSGDGARILVQRHKDFEILDTAAEAIGTHKLDLDGLRLSVDPKAEWAEMFDNAWRLERDLFFSPAINGAINGVDWPAVRARYAKLVPLLGSRDDLNWLIGQIQGELGSSHLYVGGGDDGDPTPLFQSALLGVDWSLDPATGRYRLARIYPGDNTRAAYRSPLHQPALDVKAGDYVLAINGVDLAAPGTPEALLRVLAASKPVELTVAASPDGPRRKVLVEPVRSERSLREADWIARNRAIVDRLSGGRVAYVYLSNMGGLGLQQFTRQFYAQLDKQALIIDDRWNGGGSIANYVIERLRRTPANLRTNRTGAVFTNPEDLIVGPKVALLNHWSASNGDLFPYLFRHYGLGPVVGTRPWGGVHGNRVDWPLMDGGTISVPERAPYGLDGGWIIENHGVDPDFEIENEPSDLLAGHDKQLEKAVELMLKALTVKPVTLASPPQAVPAYPAEGMVEPQPEHQVPRTD
ncbi:S41 family peptidase [Sphingomonas sp. ERG5]|uniref:S41 family peptidase n=1 Tax=Sphingomonas sp. ERG5 TaxID=1381597 RepID=UPI001364DC75|nr:S41 family peptidase [Sphingomonas sp. ERG5]